MTVIDVVSSRGLQWSVMSASPASSASSPAEGQAAAAGALPAAAAVPSPDFDYEALEKAANELRFSDFCDTLDKVRRG